jgi:hypothetical protein
MLVLNLTSKFARTNAVMRAPWLDNESCAPQAFLLDSSPV